MRCPVHPWTIPAGDTCPSCAMDARVRDIHAAKPEGEPERKFRRKVSGQNRAHGSWVAGTNRERRRGAQRREHAIEMLSQGYSTKEVAEKLGVHRYWCYDQARRHPDLARAVRGES